MELSSPLPSPFQMVGAVDAELGAGDGGTAGIGDTVAAGGAQQG